jgi:hypothetical protein
LFCDSSPDTIHFRMFHLRISTFAHLHICTSAH